MDGLDYLGLVKTSLIDFPKEVAAVIFTFGCNLRCPYCHNPEFVHGSPPSDMWSREEVLRFLEKRRNVLGGVCITGGEPFLHPEIADLIGQISSLGLKIKVDTNGTSPELLRAVKPDYIAMDLKTIPGKYHLMGASEKQTADILRSLDWLKGSGIPHEIRTTVLEPFVEESDMDEFAGMTDGADRLILARFRPGKTLDPFLSETPPPSPDFMKRLETLLAARGIPVSLRPFS